MPPWTIPKSAGVVGSSGEIELWTAAALGCAEYLKSRSLCVIFVSFVVKISDFPIPRSPDVPMTRFDPRTLMLMRLKIVFRSLRPAQSHLHGRPCPFPLRRMLRAFVEGHHNVRAQRDLYFHRPLRRKQMRRAVQMRAETYALFFHLAQLAQAEDLEAAGIGQQRPVPAHELVQPAQLAHQLVPRSQIEMVGIAQNDLRAQMFRTRSSRMSCGTAFTVPAVPTGMKAGVSTSP